MAKDLEIDYMTEFHLLPIAKHAVDSPDDWAETVDGGEGNSGDMTWFKKLVATERERYKQNPIEASPWLKLTEGDNSYYYNFQTNQRANSLPGYKPRGRLDSPAVAESDLEVMKFTSWWSENGKKKYIHVHYFMKTEDFEINIEDDDKVYRMKTVEGSAGTPLGCWDLYLKASIRVFHKSITLLQCDQDTRDWLRVNATRLLKMRKSLMDTLEKYEKVVEVPLRQSKPEEMHLRAIMNSIMRLKTKLAAYRPKLAAKYQLGALLGAD